MKLLSRLALFCTLILASISGYSQNTQLSGTLTGPDGTPFNGTLKLALEQQGAAIASTCSSYGAPTQVLPNTTVSIKVVNGSMVSAPKVWGYDCLNPSGIPYNITVQDVYGNTLYTDAWLIFGTTFNIGTAVSVYNPNINYGIASLNGLSGNPSTGLTIVGNSTINVSPSAPNQITLNVPFTIVNGHPISPETSASKYSPDCDVTQYGALGDGVTDNYAAIQGAFNVCYTSGGSVYFPAIAPLFAGPTAYYVGNSINPKGVSFHGPPGSAGQSQATPGAQLVSVVGAPGKDVFNVPDPGASAPGLISKGFTVRDIGITVDSSVDASSSGTNSFPNRLTGKTCFDAVANGTTVITSAVQCQFQPGDVGQAIKINGVTTTIASYQTVNQVTLTASVTSGTDLTAYIAVDGLSVTQTVGNCGFAMDASGLAGGYGNGPLRADFTNVVIQINGSATNNTCGTFFQGNAGPYQTKWDHDFIRGTYGMIFAMPNTSAALVGDNTCQGMCDLNEFDNMWVEASYPWISYGGNDITIKAMYMFGNYGPQILTGNGAVGVAEEDIPTEWDIDIPEIEGNCPVSGASPTTFRISGHLHVGRRISTMYCGSGVLPTFQWDASNSTVDFLQIPSLGSFNVSGYNNKFEAPFYPTAPPLAYSITGSGNLLKTCSTGTNSLIPGRCQYAGINSIPSPPQLARGSIVFNRTADFIGKGAGSYYYNNEDLMIWPNEAIGDSGAIPVVQDSTAESGAAILIVGSYSNSIYGANGSLLVYGEQVPVGKVRYYIRAKANTSVSASTTLASYSAGTGYNALCTITPALTTSYQVFYCDGDSTPYPNTLAYMSLPDAGSTYTVYVDWVAIKPWFSDLEVSGPVTASILNLTDSTCTSGTYAKGDGTGCGTPGGGSTPGTYFETPGYVNSGVGMYGDNDQTCTSEVLPPEGLSVGHIGFNVTTADGGGPSDVGIVSSSGATVLAHIGAQALSTTGEKNIALSGGTVTLPGGLVYLCYTSETSSLVISAIDGGTTMVPFFQASVTTSGGSLGTFTPPGLSPVSLASTGEAAITLYP